MVVFLVPTGQGVATVTSHKSWGNLGFYENLTNFLANRFAGGGYTQEQQGLGRCFRSWPALLLALREKRFRLVASVLYS
jgi:hypothetical protein